MKPTTRAISALALAAGMATPALAADRHWQSGVWREVSIERRMIDFGPGGSGFDRPRASPPMQAMADVRRFVIETDQARVEIEDTVPVGRASFEPEMGAMVSFAVEKKNVYVREPNGTEHKLRLIKQTPRTSGPQAVPQTAYPALGGGHVIRAVTDRGRYVALEDGSRWEIDPLARYETIEWEPAANVTVRTLSRAEGGFGYELINTSVDEGAAANYVTSKGKS